MSARLRDFLSRWQWRLLLGLLLFALFFEAVRSTEFSTPHAQFVSYLLFGAIFIATGAAANVQNWFRIISWLVLATWLLFSLFRISGTTSLLAATSALTGLIVFGCLVITFAEVTRRQAADVDTIFGAIFGYFLMALTWGLFYEQMESIRPGSFVVEGGGPTISTFFYFSLVTITTLGFGDILPMSPLTRLAAGVEAAIGTLYVAIFIGRIVTQSHR